MRPRDLDRMRAALDHAGEILRRFDASKVEVRYKAGESPVTAADLAADEALRQELPSAGEGWLSEETADDRARLACRRVWVVDPLDGTREFLDGIPEWCVSIGLVEDGVAVAGGILNPVSGDLLLGSLETGVTLNGQAVRASTRSSLDDATVLVSRWALRGKRARAFAGAPFAVRAVGPIAATLGMIASGRGDAAWSRSAKPEWDIAAGVALIAAAGGHVSSFDWQPLRFNRWPPEAPGIVACGRRLVPAVRRFLGK